jgi:PAS domain S-box-containing protein
MIRKLSNKIRYNIDPAFRIAFIYVFLSFLWILFSDSFLEYFFEDIKILTKLQTLKGWFFVSVSGVIIYILISRSFSDLKKVKKDLDKTLAFHKTLFDEFPQPIYQVSPEGKMVYLNPKCLEQPGLNKNHLLDNAWLKYVHPEDQAFVLEKYRNALLSENSYMIEFRLKQQDGSYKWVLDKGAPFYSSTGQIKGFISSCIDTHEKKEFELQLKDALELYSNLFLNNPHPMLVLDKDNLNVIEANDSAIQLYGYTKDQFCDISLKDISSSFCLESFAKLSQEEGNDFLLTKCNKHIKKSGEEVDVILKVHTLPKYKGREGIILAIQDVTLSKKAFNELLESEQRFKTLFKSSPNCNLILSKHFTVLDVNVAACSFFNKGPELLVKKSLHDLFGDNFRDFFLRFFEEVDRIGFFQETVSNEFNDNKDFAVEVFCLSFNEKGQQRYYFSFRNVTDKIIISKALEESERRLNNLIDNLPGMVYRCANDPHYTMEYVSIGSVKLTGYTPEELEHNKAISYGELIESDDRKRIWDEVQDNIYTRKTIPLIYRIITANKSVKWVMDQSKGFFDKSGELLFIEGFVSDITEEKNTQEALVFQSNLMKSIIDNIPFPVFYKNLEGKYIGCNQEFSNYVGLSIEDILGKTIYDLFPKEQAEIFAEKDRQLYQSLTTQVYETKILYKTGRIIDALFFKSVFFDASNNAQGIVGVYLDISDRVRAEETIKEQMKELARINSELERFTYTVSHDLRSPLVTIQGFLNLIKESAVNGDFAQMEEDISRIEKASEKMHYLLEDLLHLSRVGRMKDNFQEFSMDELIKEVTAILHGVIAKSEAKLIIKEGMPSVFGDRARIGELWQNLIENALKFKGKEKPEISIGFFINSENKVVYYVEDNGIGIESNFHEKVFGLFNKLNPNTEGTGVGLAIVHRILEVHGGEIWCESEGLNKGTKFLFTIGNKNDDVKNTN